MMALSDRMLTVVIVTEHITKNNNLKTTRVSRPMSKTSRTPVQPRPSRRARGSSQASRQTSRAPVQGQAQRHLSPEPVEETVVGAPRRKSERLRKMGSALDNE